MPTQPNPRLETALEYLLSGDILWARRYEPESMRLLSRLWRDLPADGAARLIERVMAGPPDVDNDGRRAWWLASRLAEMRAAGGPQLPPEALSQLDAVEAEHGAVEPPSASKLGLVELVRLAVPERAGISEKNMLALELDELARMLSEPQVRHDRFFDDTRECLMTLWRGVVPRRPLSAVAMLERLADMGVWPVDTWQATLLGFDEMPRRSFKAAVFRRIAHVLVNAPDTFLEDKGAAWAIGFWLPAATRATPLRPDDLFWPLWDRLASFFFAHPLPSGEDRDPLHAAINEPPGRLTEALLHRFFAHGPKTGRGIPSEVEPRLRLVVSGQGKGFRLGRVILARHLTALFVTEPGWALKHLVPLFDWSEPSEAAAVWRGFLAGGSIDPKVFTALKDAFIETLRHHDGDVHDSKERLWWTFVMVSIEIAGFVDPQTAQSLLRSAAPDARRHAAFQLYRMMPDDPASAASFWTARIGPWIDSAWPKDVGLREAGSSEALALAAVLSGGSFPGAMDLTEDLLVPCDRHLRLVHRLAETDLPDQYPEEVLRLLNVVISKLVPYWGAAEVRGVLERLVTANRALAEDHRYRRLDAELRRHGK